MNPWAYYSEFDPHAADWLRNLIKIGAIAPGEVDDRDLRDVHPDDLRGFTQVHFCAGIGVWSYSLRRAGWPDHRPVWTGSFPCQSFSATGRKKGFADERHLWPVGYRLIAAHRPPVFFGEQVASALVLGRAEYKKSEHGPYGLYGEACAEEEPTVWLDLVQTDLESSNYAVGTQGAPAAGVGAPHIRSRTYFVAHRLDDAERPGLEGYAGNGDGDGGRSQSTRSVAASGVSDALADSEGIGGRAGSCDIHSRRLRGDQQRDGGEFGGLADAYHLEPREGRNARSEEVARSRSQSSRRSSIGGMADSSDRHFPQQIGRPKGRDGDRSDRQNDGIGARWARPTNGRWGDVDWLFCRDGKWRPVEPGTLPLVDGASFRLGSGSTYEGKSRQDILKGYGNAIVSEVASAFIEDYLETIGNVIDGDLSSGA